MVNKRLEEGHWVKWHTSDGFLMFGKVLGQPDLNRTGQFIVPVETLNGSKTIVQEDKLEIVPHQPKGKMTDKKKQELIEAMAKHNKDKNSKQIIPGKGTPIDMEALAHAREQELNEKEQSLQIALTKVNKLEEENSVLKLEKTKLQEDLIQKDAEIKRLNQQLFIAPTQNFIDDVKVSIDELKIINEDLIKNEDDEVKKAPVILNILGILYRLIKYV